MAEYRRGLAEQKHQPMQQVWEYEDATGATRRGVMLEFSVRGGSDVTYKFHRLGSDGKPVEFRNGGRCVDYCSGERLKRTRPDRPPEDDLCAGCNNGA